MTNSNSTKRHIVGYDIVGNCAELAKDKTFSNLYKLICSHGNTYAAFWIENGERLHASFDELAQKADDWGAAIAAKIGTGGRVAISLDACKEWFPLFWGLVRTGHDTLLLDASMSDEKAAATMDRCNCTVIISGKRRLLPAKYRTLEVKEFYNAPKAKNFQAVWGHDIALCTSGTTAESNIFVYDEETICEIALFSEKVFHENKLLIDNTNFRTLAFLPFHHILGFAGIFIWSHFLGYTTVYLKDRAPQTIMETVKRCKVSQIVTVPLLANSLTKTFYAKLRKENGAVRWLFNVMIGFSLMVQNVFPKAGHRLAARMFRSTQEKMLGTHIKSIVLGGSHADPASLKLMNAIGYYTLCGFGMTETAITSFETNPALVNRLKGSIGAPMSNTEYRIKGGGTVGELQIRGAGMHDGRFVDGKLLPPDIDSEGWFSSGDIVRINKAAHQYLVEGRIKEVIVNESGENVYPDELEDFFPKAEGVEQLTVLGTARKDSKYEDITLLMNVGKKFNDEFFLKALSETVHAANAALPAYKRLSRILVTPTTLPAANGFKIKRIEVRKLINNGRLELKDLTAAGYITRESTAAATTAPAAPGADKRDEMIAKVREVFAEVLSLPLDSIKNDSHFIDDLHGDSLQMLAVLTNLEEAFSIMVPSEEYISCSTPNNTADMLLRVIYGAAHTPQLVERTPVTRFEDSDEYKTFRHRIDDLLASGDDPYFIAHDSPLRDTCVVNGRTLIDFGNYNYAGMSGRPEVNEAAKKAIDHYGTSASGSRLLAGEKPIHQELEKAIAEWKHAEAAVVCVGGHSTNVTFVGNFCGKNDLILYDALAHNSVAQGCKLSEAMTKSFPHNDVKALESILEKQRKYFEKVLIVIEGVYSMDGDISDVPAFVEVKKKYGCFLMVDEAHSACVLGKTGGGVDEYFHLAGDDIDIKMGTLSKGLGTCGGYLAGSQALITYLKYNLPGFVFSVGLSPALAAASLEAIRLLREDPSIMEHMQRNIECFASEARKRNLNIGKAGRSAIIPVLIGSDEDAFLLSNELNRKGIAVPPAVYPAVPRGKARLRFDVTSEHKEEQIIFALDTLVSTAKELGITLPPAE